MRLPLSRRRDLWLMPCKQPPIYNAEAMLLPPEVEDIKSLNFLGVLVTGMVEHRECLEGEYVIGVNAVFAAFK